MLVDEEHFGAFYPTSAELSALYVPDRRDDPSEGVAIETLRSAAGIQVLLRDSFMGRVIGAGDRSAMRLRLLADVLASLPIKRLSYPERRDCLADAVAAIERDVHDSV